jgi:hypothetical protein
MKYEMIVTRTIVFETTIEIEDIPNQRFENLEHKTLELAKELIEDQWSATDIDYKADVIGQSD